MKIQPECVPCLLKRIVFETIQSTNDNDLRFKTIKNACTLLSKLYDKNECSAIIATKVHKIAYKTLEDNDPYKKLKEKSNRVAKELVPHVEDLIDSSDDPLRITIVCSIVGNIMDFGIEGVNDDPENLSEKFDEYFIQDLYYDDSDILKKILLKSKKVLLFTDNSGEIVFDKILCRELKKFNNKIFLSVVVKGEPIISDATLKDVKELNFYENCDEILTTGGFAIGLDFDKIPRDLKKAIKESDLIICKGMANYEAFSEKNYKPIAYLLRTKCSAIANSMGLPINVNAVKVYN
jgi:uncharacterized protein with ATP-grasp and redox domains